MTKQTQYDVEFYFGVRPIKQFDLYVTALFLCLAVRLIVRINKNITPMEVWAIIDEIGQHYHIRIINHLIIRVPELLSGRINRDLDKAIDDAKIEMGHKDPEIPEPTWIDEKEGATPLGGTLGYTYDFIEKNDDKN